MNTILTAFLLCVSAHICHGEMYVMNGRNLIPCGLLNITGSVNIDYIDNDGKPMTANIDLDGTRVEGNCSDVHNNFAEIIIFKGDDPSLALKTSLSGNEVNLDEISYTYDTSKLPFVNAKNPAIHTDKIPINKVVSSSNQYVYCDEPQLYTANANSLRLSIQHFQMQLFNVKSSTFGDDGAEYCQLPGSTTPSGSTTISTEAPTGTTIEPITSDEPVTTGEPTGTTVEPITTDEPVTTGKPTGTTVKPITTDEPVTSVEPTGTTVEPIKTTTEHSNITTRPMTTEKPTIPATTAKPTETPGVPKFEVKDPQTGTVCLVVQFELSFRIPYNTKDKKKAYKDIDIDHSSIGATSGKCSENVNSIKIYFTPSVASNANDWTVAMEFEKSKDNASSSMTRFSFGYQIDPKIFPNAENPGQSMNATQTFTGQFKTNVGSYYSCQHTDKFDLAKSGISVTTEKMKVKSFNDNKDDDFKKMGAQCGNDIAVNNVVPIVVGVVLCLLVIIVLAAYFIGRRRRSASGYQEI